MAEDSSKKTTDKTWSTVLAGLNIALLIILASGCYLLWFSLDPNLKITQQLTEARLGAMLVFAMYAFMFGLVTPAIVVYLRDSAESQQLWEYTEEGIYIGWYTICLGVGFVVLALLLKDLWPTYIVPKFGFDPAPEATPAFMPGGMMLALAIVMAGIGSMPPNKVVGYRIPATLKSADNWQHVHASVRRFIPIPAAIAGLIMLTQPMSESLGWIAGIIVACLLLIPLLNLYLGKGAKGANKDNK